VKLREGTFPVGQPFYSLKELCDHYGVSQITAQRVFQELKREGWISPVRRRGTVVSRGAARTEVIFVGASDDLDRNDLHPRSGQHLFLDGLKKREDFYHVRVVTVGHNFFLPRLREFADKNVVMPACFLRLLRVSGQEEAADFLRDVVRPVILYADRGECEGFTCVETDYRKGISKVVEHLLAKGHRRVAFLTGDAKSELDTFHQRLSGYLDACRAASIPVDLNLIKTTSGVDPEPDWKALDGLLAMPEPPTAVACANDSRALHVLEYCEHKHIRVPKDMAVAGFDNRDETRFMRPPLTTVDMRLREQGARALELMMSRMSGRLKEPVVVRVDPELVVREST